MPTVALLGTGLLGKAIGLRLLKQGVTLKVWNRSAEKYADLVLAGATPIKQLAGAASGCDTVITVLRDGPVSANVVADLGDFGGACCMPMGTMGIHESRDLAVQVDRQNGCYLEAPVLGSRPEALTGSLLVMAGGDRAVFEGQRPLLELLAEQPRLMGAIGSGAASKLALNQLIASLTHGYSLALRLVQASGLDVERFMEVLRPSALYAPTVDKKLARMLGKDYANPNFSTGLLRKDLGLFLQEAALCGVDASGLDSLMRLLQRAEGTALDSGDYCGLHELTDC